MRKSISLIIAMCVILSTCLCGCSSSKSSDKDTTTKAALTGSIDVDLTKLSSTMIYSEVSNMMSTPADYMTKVVKVKGSFNTSYSSETDTRYYFVIISDATACCQQGLEFIVDGDTTYPDDYPATGAEVEVTGVFQSYEELGKTYYYLSTDKIDVL